ncbi:DUF6303 family protein [Streptomyces sp. JV185]|uniref:DUF6303 family protein n=1 Tax=Streptomyces sp. JV185 TaxID=858638 RepID=UPI002E79D658|nr:DUF6303 family protein [Streptomyces sp. JV185]MEE1773231.1 DUF6303 family protein [Streptomyces sp. JV185]
MNANHSLQLPAQMSNSGGRWHLYIPLMNTPGLWPEHDWHRSAPTPTLAEREQALNALGYETVPGAEWTWVEDSDVPDEPTSSVWLIATVMIRTTVVDGAA